MNKPEKPGIIGGANLRWRHGGFSGEENEGRKRPRAANLSTILVANRTNFHNDFINNFARIGT